MFLPEQLAIPDLRTHLEVFLYLDQSMFCQSGSPVLLFVVTGNMILVAGRVVMRTGMGL